MYINNKTTRGGDISVMYLISYIPLTAPLSINPHKLSSYSNLLITFSLIFLASHSKNAYSSPLKYGTPSRPPKCHWLEAQAKQHSVLR